MAAFYCRGFRILARFSKTVNIFQHHDGIVHHHSDAERQAAEGHQVQRKPAQIHQGKGGNHRYGNRDGNNSCAGDVTEKKQQYA